MFKAWTSLAVLLLRETGLARFSYFLRARRGYFGAPEDWDAEYSSGKWQFLQELDQASHYQLIALYRARMKPQGSVLDVGCGEGILHDALNLPPRVRYVGIDPSATAIAMAEAEAGGNATFHVATAETFATAEKFDVIVFNEVLYYCADPGAVVRKYADFLKEDGIFIVSMALCGVRDGLTKLLVWQEIERDARVVAEISVVAPTAGWVIKVIKPISSAASSLVQLPIRRVEPASL